MNPKKPLTYQAIFSLFFFIVPMFSQLANARPSIWTGPDTAIIEGFGFLPPQDGFQWLGFKITAPAKADIDIFFGAFPYHQTASYDLLRSTVRQFGGDFLGLGHAQVFVINWDFGIRDPGMRVPKLAIRDYYSGTSVLKYIEYWGYSYDDLLNGFLDPGDVILDGDFRGLGHDQMMFIDRTGSGFEIMKILDYAWGYPEVKYSEIWRATSILAGFLNSDDILISGDFKNLGHSQVMLINRQKDGHGKIKIVDYVTGSPVVLYSENWGDNTLLDGWLEPGNNPQASFTFDWVWDSGSSSWKRVHWDKVMFFDGKGNSKILSYRGSTPS